MPAGDHGWASPDRLPRRGLLRRWLVFALALLLGHRAEARSPRIAGAPAIRFNGRWGEGEPAVLAELCGLAMDEVLQHLTPGEIATLPRRIDIVPDRKGPFAAVGPHDAPTVVVHLSARDHYWAQYLHQFSHEFGHIMANYRRVDFTRNPHQWLEEAICGALSMFCLERAPATALTEPTSRLHDFAPSLKAYVADVRLEYQADAPIESLKFWLVQHADELNRARGLVPAVKPLAVWLDERFQQEPALLGSVRYLNTWDVVATRPLADHLRRWLASCAARRDHLPRLLMREIGLVG